MGKFFIGNIKNVENSKHALHSNVRFALLSAINYTKLPGKFGHSFQLKEEHMLEDMSKTFRAPGGDDLVEVFREIRICV